MYCPECGKEIPDIAEYCPECGTKIDNPFLKKKSKVSQFFELVVSKEGEIPRTLSSITFVLFPILSIFSILRFFNVLTLLLGVSRYLEYIKVKYNVILLIIFGLLYFVIVYGILTITYSKKYDMDIYEEEVICRVGKSFIIPELSMILFIIFSFFFGAGSLIAMIFGMASIINDAIKNNSFENELVVILVDAIIMLLVIVTFIYFGIKCVAIKDLITQLLQTLLSLY